MEIRFNTPKIEDALNGEKDGSYSVLEKMLKKQNAKCSVEDIIQAYAVLKTAEYIKEIPPSYRFHGLSGNLHDEYAINIDKSHRIIFKIIDPSVKKEDQKNARKIEITFIGLDYHK